MLGILIHAGNIDLERTEPRRECLLRRRRQRLTREALHAVAPERLQHLIERGIRERLREVQSVDGGAQDSSGRDDLHHLNPRELLEAARPGPKYSRKAVAAEARN